MLCSCSVFKITTRFFDHPWALKTLESMNKIWPNLLDTKSNVDFWSQQWRKHDTCAKLTGTRNVSEYFTKTINLASMYNIDQ
ncbi:ribonuclease Oy-like [Saccostrea cucullata]|uniref:ribonuclease Oy-like n=1 Tax=Saccostrea cuccullata TaxID=36930 RepID=UPI002ED3C7F8